MKILILLLAAPAWAQPSPAPEIVALERRIEALERREGVVSVGEKGFVVRTPDGSTQLRIRGFLQGDARAYLGDDSKTLADTFLVRRARIILEATFFNFLDFKIVPDFANSTLVLFDAYMDIRALPWLRLRVGKFKPPVGLERLQSAPNIEFLERAYPTSLVPNRDVGAMLFGELRNGALSWQLGVFNGVVDGANLPDTDLRDGKELAARVFAHPLRPLKIAALENFAIGLAGTYGIERGRLGASGLPSYRSTGQQTFFAYLSDALADGNRWRITPQAYWFVDRFGILGEYVQSVQDVKKGSDKTSITNQAWQVQLVLVLTPHDKASFDGVIPSRPLGWKQRGWGAFELIARYHELDVDDGAFPKFADPTKSARSARSFGVGVNWYVNRNIRVGVNFERSDFQGNRAPENFLAARLQTSF